MDKVLFSDSFKNLMVALGAKTSDSSYAVPLVNKTSGVPQGFMEMSALASVLGVVTLANKCYLICSQLIIGDFNLTSSPSNITEMHEEFVTKVREYLGTTYNSTYIFNCQIGSGGRHHAQGIIYNIDNTPYSEFTFTNLNGTISISKEVNGVFSQVS